MDLSDTHQLIGSTTALGLTLSCKLYHQDQSLPKC